MASFLSISESVQYRNQVHLRYGKQSPQLAFTMVNAAAPLSQRGPQSIIVRGAATDGATSITSLLGDTIV